MKTLEKGMYLLPDDQFEFELKKHPLTKQEIQGENKSLMTIVTPEILENSQFMQKLNGEKTHTLIRSEVYFDKFYTPEEFDKRNAEDVAEVIQEILCKLGARNIRCESIKSDKTKESMDAKQNVDVNASYGEYEGGIKVDNSANHSAESNNEKEVKKGVQFLGKAVSKAELDEYIQTEGIDTEALPGWLRGLIKNHGGVNLVKHFEQKEYKLDYNKDISNKITKISANVKITPMFKGSLGVEFSKDNKKERVYHETIIFDIDFGEE